MRRYTGFDEAVLKHLEFIQEAIARMGRNSFLLKGWSVTLVAAIFALSARNPSIYLVLVALFPALAFWGLDAFYLAQERRFRKLHEDVIEGNVGAFSMEPSGYEKGARAWFKVACSRSVLPFHLIVVLTVGFIILALLLLANVGGSPPKSGEETTAWVGERRLPHG